MLVNTLIRCHGPLTDITLPVEPLDNTLGAALVCLPDFAFANAPEEAPNNITITIANLSITELHRANFFILIKNGIVSLVNYPS